MPKLILWCLILTIFEYAESNAEWCQAQLFMQRPEFYDLKSALKIARKSYKNKGFSQYKAYVCLLWPTVWGVHKLILQCYFKLFSSMRNIMPSGPKFNYSCKSSNCAILGHVWSNTERCQAEKLLYMLKNFDSKEALKIRKIAINMCARRRLHAWLSDTSWPLYVFTIM